MAEGRWKEKWIPPWAPHVVGEYDMPREFREDGLPEAQWVEMTCTHAECASRPKPHYRVPCTSGNVRQHVARFALVHMHKDPFEGGK